MNPDLSRRAFLGAGLTVTTMAAIAACTPARPPAAAAVNRIMPDNPLVAATEASRPATGTTVTRALTADALTADVGGHRVATWGYNNTLNGPVIRAKAGDRLTVPLSNRLKQPTTIHWHGLALRNNMDGVQGLTQTAVPAGGGSMTYDFRLPHPGTYWYHSHVEMQRERGLYGPLIIEDPREPLAYDQEWVIVLDDWLDGITGTPDEVVKELSRGMGNTGTMGGMNMGSDTASPSAGMTMGHMLMGSYSAFLGGDAGDVSYPFHLFNSRTPDRPETFTSKPGHRIRLRVINAAGDTAYRVGVPGQKITVTHSDGYPVKHQDLDAVVLGMGERADLLLTVKPGQTPVLALPEGKPGRAYGIVSTGTGTAPAAADLPRTLDGTVLDGGSLKADPSVLLAAKAPDTVHELHLTGGMAKYDWGLNGRRFDMNNPLAGTFDIRQGNRVQVKFINDTTMWHPMHLHGHTFQLAGNGARKDTVIVRPRQTVTVEFDADNPGQWLTHCHNAYHAQQGMMGVFSYIA
ncbi:multicopper oxidase family protein [Paenarthrobacter sp. DKR-5]|uniref:multicopper oxidase family protein n=1 Tax=Paenarthrobacter sp. DKR-5 TaxID=2835535 RepID=UPI0027DB48F4|nr:multicopper oxidase family protein [Paenarthrobacter sp. DKR-5]